MKTATKELNMPTNEATSPEEAYRNAVLAAADGKTPMKADGQILVAAGRFENDFVEDVVRLRRRRQEATAPEQAAELRRQAAALDGPVVDPRSRPIESFKTPHEVIDMWVNFTAHANHQVTKTMEQAHHLRMDARTLENEALRFLRETSDPAIAAEIEQLGKQIGSLQVGISHRAELVNLDSAITSTRQQIDGLLKGERRSDTVQKVAEGRARLRALEAMRPGVADAVAANERDEKKIAALQTRIAELRREQFIPERMRWSLA